MMIQKYGWKSRLLVGLFLLLITNVALVAQQSNTEQHTVAKGETIYRISLNYGVTIEELYRLNPAAVDGIKVGQKLVIPTKSETIKKGVQDEPTYHKVEHEETLYSISRKYGVTVDAILSANPSISNPDKLALGTIIMIPLQSNSVPIFRESGAKPSSTSGVAGVTGLITYTVPTGATIYSLLQITGWSEAQFFHYNPQVKGGLKAGATILIPDNSVKNNQAMGSQPAFPIGSGYTVALALPFSDDKGNRFSLYYEGFLMALLEAKKSGMSVHLYAVDCADQQLDRSISLLTTLPQVDLILGGVSERSIIRLARVANLKGALYVIPFTSKDYSNAANGGAKIYQVNTPHQALYSEVAQKFASEYKDSYVQIIRSASGKSNKEDFASVLINELTRHNIPYSESSLEQFSNLNTIQDISAKKRQAVVVPDVGSLSVAKSILETINVARDSLYVTNVIPFGYPEWQTYYSSLGNDMKASNATFYTTFFAEPESHSYTTFNKEFRKWYKHGLGNTYPRYSLLGYDTGCYFLELLSSRDKESNKVWRGLQSKFEFMSQRGNKFLKSNLGVFFVQYQNVGEAKRF